VIPLKDENPTSSTAWVTILLVAVNVGVWLFVQQGQSGIEAAEFSIEYAAIPCEVVEGRPLTVDEINITYSARGDDEACGLGGSTSPAPFPDKQIYLAVLFSMFLHGSWLHIGGNMLFLWIFGNNIEDRMGPVRYLLFYVIGGLAAFAAHVVPQTASTVPVIGASGAVAAVMGAYLVWYPNAPVRTLFIIFLIWIRDVRAKWLLAAWFVLQFFTGQDSGIAWLAHVGGFVFGAAIALATRAMSGMARVMFDADHRPSGRWDSTGGIGRGPYDRDQWTISDEPGNRRFGGRRY
jgi:membrane associated rhomboid family serine protease